LQNDLSLPPRKLTHYAPDADSPHGRHKAVLFKEILGFTKENYEELIRQVEMKAPEAEAVFHSEDQFGKRYSIDLQILGNTGLKAVVRTGWIVSGNSDEAQLVTIYVKERKICRK